MNNIPLLQETISFAYVQREVQSELKVLSEGAIQPKKKLHHLQVNGELMRGQRVYWVPQVLWWHTLMQQQGKIKENRSTGFTFCVGKYLFSHYNLCVRTLPWDSEIELTALYLLLIVGQVKTRICLKALWVFSHNKIWELSSAVLCKYRSGWLNVCITFYKIQTPNTL